MLWPRMLAKLNQQKLAFSWPNEGSGLAALNRKVYQLSNEASQLGQDLNPGMR